MFCSMVHCYNSLSTVRVSVHVKTFMLKVNENLSNKSKILSHPFFLHILKADTGHFQRALNKVSTVQQVLPNVKKPNSDQHAELRLCSSLLWFHCPVDCL